MRTQRGRFDITKPFRLITNRVEFDALEATEKLFPPPKQAEHEEKNENIVVPRIQKVKRLTNPKEFAVINSNYIRLPANLNLPKMDGYELSQVDYLFLNKLRKRAYLVSAGITEEFLQRAIVTMEKKAGRDNVIPRGKGWMDSFIEKQYRHLTELPNYAQLSTELYNYWRSRREELRFPLYRPLWKPHENELNHLLAFKAREKITRNRRRNNRIDEIDLLQQLSDQFYNAAKLCQRIRVRQDFKMKNIQLQAASFFQQCLVHSNLPPPFALPTSLSFRTEDREKHRKLRQSLQEFKKRRDNQQDPQQQYHENIEAKQIVNQSDTLVNFLSSVVYQAGKIGLSHDIIFPDSYEKNVPKKVLPPPEKYEQPVLPNIKEEVEEVTETMPFKFIKYGDMLIRSVSEEDDNQILHAPKDYLTFKRKRVQCSYFGNDDNIGDFRELRKNISSSFKKFMQITNLGNNSNQSSNN